MSDSDWKRVDKNDMRLLKDWSRADKQPLTIELPSGITVGQNTEIKSIQDAIYVKG